MVNETGVIVGRLDASVLRELILNYRGCDESLRRRLFDWYDLAKELEAVDDELAKLGLDVSKPVIQIGRKIGCTA